MTFKQVKALFIKKYPNGSIYKESTYNMNNVFNVSYNANSKVYTYRVCNLLELCYKLKLKDRPLLKEDNKSLEELNDNGFGIIFK